MAKKKNHYYVVWEGHQPGIYNSWADCQLQIKAYPNAKYKGFATKAEAEKAFKGHYQDYYQRDTAPKKKSSTKRVGKIISNSWSVDAACSGNPGLMEYRGVHTELKEELFRVGPLEGGTNNVGEILALVHALALLQSMGREDVPIYSDSKIAMGWYKKKKINTKLKRTPKNGPIFTLIERAEKWMAENNPKNKILKWHTDQWGEIPADFGRK